MTMVMSMLLPQLAAVLMSSVTPALRGMLASFALDFYRKAKGTPNPADDVAAGLILQFLGLPTPTDG